MDLRLDQKLMQLALEEAQRASELEEVPVGAVIADREGRVIAKTHNLCEAQQNPLAHAEILAIHQACQRLGKKWLQDCTLYVTLEPCPMCTGALIHARIGRVVYGARDPRAGACGTMVDLPSYPLEAHPQIRGEFFAEESLQLLKSFFETRRKRP